MKTLLTLILILFAFPIQAQEIGIFFAGDEVVSLAPLYLDIKDYHFVFDKVIKEGVTRFVDEKNKTVAIVDIRDEEGIYIEVKEGDSKMQIVLKKATGGQPA